VVGLATVSFLPGGQKLMEAVGDATLAAKYGLVIDNLNKGGITKENLGKVDEIAAELKKLAEDKEAMGKAETKKVEEAAVKVGVATYFETQGVNGARRAASNMNVSNAAEMGLLATLAPKNLQSMLATQSA